eukprot:scaffold39383_cov329-Skeletonema_marinoi.AAC.1
MIITPYQEVYSDDEDEDEMDEDKIDSWDQDSTATSVTAQQSSSAQPLVEESCEFDEYSNSRTDDNKRKRTSCGQTKAQSQRVRREDAKLDRRRPTENYLCWAAPGNQYDRAKQKINELYVKSLQFGVVEKFYEKKIHLQRSKTRFDEHEKTFR